MKLRKLKKMLKNHYSAAIDKNTVIFWEDKRTYNWWEKNHKKKQKVKGGFWLEQMIGNWEEPNEFPMTPKDLKEYMKDRKIMEMWRDE